MNRFFSKLDLRDIKIDPQGSRFPPDAEETATDLDDVVEAEPSAMRDELMAHPAALIEPEIGPVASAPTARQPYVPAWSNGATKGGSLGQEAVVDTVTAAVAGPEIAATPNGHRHGDDAVNVEHHGEVLKVSARSRPSAVAGAIAGVVRESGRAEVQAIGAGATNQAIKAVAIARDYLRETGIEAVCLPAFIDVTIENEDRTAIRLVVEPR